MQSTESGTHAPPCMMVCLYYSWIHNAGFGSDPTATPMNASNDGMNP